jgi:hypothetical protein
MSLYYARFSKLIIDRDKPPKETYGLVSIPDLEPDPGDGDFPRGDGEEAIAGAATSRIIGRWVGSIVGSLHVTCEWPAPDKHGTESSFMLLP